MYTLKFAREAADEIEALRPFDQRRILDALQDLRRAPFQAARNRKQLLDVEAERAPLWELRIGEYRVFYDVDEEQQHVVIVLSVRKKGRKTTKEILCRRSPSERPSRA